MGRLESSGHEVQLAAGAADLPQPRGLRADLPVEVHGEAAVDGDEIRKLADHRRVVDVAHGRGEDRNVVIEEIIELAGAVADAEDALAAVELLAPVGDLPGPIERQVAVAHQLRVHAQILQVGLGDEAAEGVGHAADAELQGDAVREVREDIGGDLPVDVADLHRRGMGKFLVVLDDGVHFRDMDAVRLQAHDVGHVRVDLDDHFVRRVDQLLLGAVREPVAEIAVAVHRGHGDHRDVHRRVAALIVAPAMPEEHRREIGPARVEILPVESRAVPYIIGEALLLRVLLHHLHRAHRDRAAQLHVVQLALSRGERAVERRRKGQGLAVIHPVAVLYESDGLLCRAESLAVLFMDVHGYLLQSSVYPMRCSSSSFFHR